MQILREQPRTTETVGGGIQLSVLKKFSRWHWCCWSLRTALRHSRTLRLINHFPYVKRSIYGFSSSHVWMWELDYKESWAPKNWCFSPVVLEKTLESPLDCKEIKPVNPKRNQFPNIHWKDWCLSWSSNTLATWWEDLTHLKRLWWWERLKAGGDRGWDLVGITNSMDMSLSKLGSCWWTGKPGML